MKYIVKNIKSFQGREGYGYECSLYKDGKRIGTVTNTASGGMTDFYLNKGEEKILDNYCETLPKEPWQGKDDILSKKEFNEIYPDGFTIKKDSFISSLVDKFEEKKQFKSWSKGKTVFRLDGDKDGSYRTISITYTKAIKQHLEKQYEGKGLVILNETIKS